MASMRIITVLQETHFLARNVLGIIFVKRAGHAKSILIKKVVGLVTCNHEIL